MQFGINCGQKSSCVGLSVLCYMVRVKYEFRSKNKYNFELHLAIWLLFFPTLEGQIMHSKNGVTQF